MSNIIKINDYLINLDNLCYARACETFDETNKALEPAVELIMANSSWSRIVLRNISMKELEFILENLTEGDDNGE